MKSRINKAGVEMVECDACGGMGYDGIEEDTGRPFSCYACGESGWITKAAFDEAEAIRVEEAAKLDAEAAARRKEYGVPDGWGYCLDEYEGVILIPPQKPWEPKPPRRIDVDMDEDIPF